MRCEPKGLRSVIFVTRGDGCEQGVCQFGRYPSMTVAGSANRTRHPVPALPQDKACSVSDRNAHAYLARPIPDSARGRLAICHEC